MASVKVAVRVRPFNQREKDMDARLIISMDGRKTRIENAKEGGRQRHKDFTFDHSYWSFDPRDPHYASQEKVFEDLGMEVVASAFEGYNACVFAYGQTGSGKTFTMMGSAECQGLIPRICKNLFGRVHAGKEQGASYRTEVSYLEIYNERVKDLLHRDEVGHGLRVREHPRLGPYVQDLSRHLVSDFLNIQELMIRGNNHRTTACTNMNDVSSRSHAIFTLMFVQAGFAGGMPSETVSKVHLVDLAGSERADATGATGQRLKEGAHINKSLVTLGSVISALAELSSGIGGDGTNRQLNSRSVFIPYRDSVLTWLLKDSLGGNSKTIMIAAVSPADCNYGETLSTLRYANRAKNIINKPTINEDPNVKLIRELRDEITKLRALLGSEFTMESQPQMVAALHQKEAKEKELTEEWTEKWRETQQILHEQKTLGLRKSGVGVVLDSDRPHLVGIDDDLLSTGVTLYHLKEGETLIGSEDAQVKPDIVLNGVGVEPEHCSVVLKGGTGTLIPKGNAQCWVNTVLVDKPTRLSQGCIIILGRTNMFRYNDPAEAAKMRKEGSRSHLNLSRLSLLSWSTSDLDWSTENLLTSVDDSEKLDDLETQRASLLKEREAFKREQAEKELDWEKELRRKKEMLELAQKELDEERQQMELEYQMQKRKLAEDWQRLEHSQQDALLALQARETELQLRKEELTRERQVQSARAESASKCISTLGEEIDGKKERLRSFIMEKMSGTVATGDEYLKRSQGSRLSQSLCELNELNCQKTYAHQTGHHLRRRSDPSSAVFHCCRTFKEDVLCVERLRSFRDTLAKQRQELAKLEVELQTKLKIYNNHIDRVANIETELSAIEAKQNVMKKLVSSEVTSTEKLDTIREILSKRSMEQLESIAHKKQSLTLELQSIVRSEEAGEKKVADLSSQETFHSANSEFEGDKKSSCDDERFTDASRCGSDLDMCTTSKDFAGKEANRPLNELTNELSPTSGYSDDILKDHQCALWSGGASYGCEAERLEENRVVEGGESVESLRLDPQVVTGWHFLPENGLLRAEEALGKLSSELEQQKALVLQNLQNNCDKEEINQQISVLQELQRHYVRLEFSLESPTAIHAQDLGGDEYSGNSEASSHERKQYQGSIRKEDLYNSSVGVKVLPCCPCVCRGGLNRRSLTAIHSECCSFSEINFRSPSSPNLYQSSGIHGHRRSSCSNLNLGLSLSYSSSILSPMSMDEADQSGFSVYITSYHLRGSGTFTHYEYEVKLTIEHGEAWTILRRYRQFRQMHLSLKAKYGAKVEKIPFPPRKIFGKNLESVAKTRQKLLEVYLHQLLSVCSTIECCPLFSFWKNPSRHALFEFSSFFRISIFDSGKYGTG